MAQLLQGSKSWALRRIAELSATVRPGHNDHENFDKLYGALPACQDGLSSSREESNSAAGVSLARTPMTIGELHVLLALCEASPRVSRIQEAEQLLSQLSPYLLEAQEQTIAHSPYLLDVSPSPWEALTYSLTSALLTIGIKHPSLSEPVSNCVLRYISQCRQERWIGYSNQIQPNGSHSSSKHKRPLEILMLSMSLLGYLEAIAQLVHFFSPANRHILVNKVHSLLSDDFMVAVEGALSSLRNMDTTTRSIKCQQQLADKYAISGRPLGAMLLQQAFMTMLVSCASLQIARPEILESSSVLDHLASISLSQVSAITDDDSAMAETLSHIATDTIRVLDEGADYLELSSAWQRHLALKVRGNAFMIYITCVLVDENVADADILMSWLDSTMSDPAQTADAGLAGIVFKCLSILAKTSPAIAATLSRLLPRFIIQHGNDTQIVDTAATCFAAILQVLSQDAVITSLYSLGNVLSGSNSDKALGSNGGPLLSQNNARYTQHSTASAISFEAQGDEEMVNVFANVIRSIVTVATICSDKNILPLAQSMLLQKLQRLNATVDSFIIIETAALGAKGEQAELKALLKLYDRLSHDAVVHKNELMLSAVRKAHSRLATSIPKSSPSFGLYIVHLLETIVGKGDVRERPERHSQQRADVELAAEEIGQLLLPLSILAPHFFKSGSAGEETVASLQREVWFNIAVHGIIPGSPLWQKHLPELRALAIHTKPLVAQDRTDHLESDIELNTVLRRGMTGPYTAEMKKHLIKLLPSQESHIRSLAYPKVIFLHASLSVETLRAENGACVDVLTYFADPSVNQDGISQCMAAIADRTVSLFLASCENGLQARSAAHTVSSELAQVLAMCCHRIFQCQKVAVSFADKMIGRVPSSLCQKSSLFALLEILTLMWSSCLEAEIDEYEWKSSHVSSLGGIRLELSDDYDYRRATLKAFHQRAKIWALKVIDVAPLDVKGLFQTYLSEFDDDGAYGHVALGRSFAVDMGAAIPNSDQRLSAIDRFDEYSINTASDFVAQYTTRQEYKHAEALPGYDQEWLQFLKLPDLRSGSAEKHHRHPRDAQAILSVLQRRTKDGKYITLTELRDLLRRAAALICRSEVDQCAILHHLVDIPFALFSKQSLKLGISLWLGVINENPSMESRVLTEIANSWEESVHKRQGIFKDKSPHLDPFFLREEYAPSDRHLLAKRQQAASNVIAPHLRVLQFLSSHLEAYRLGSPHLRKTYQRMTSTTLDGLKVSSSHPLAREFHFQVILFSIMVFRYSEDLTYPLRWRLKDQILSAGLAWFARAPRFSFGGNRLQIKAECQLLMDVDGALKRAESIGSSHSNVLHSLATKQDLLVRLVEHEYSKLQVWLYPTAQELRHTFSSNRGDKHPLTTLSTSALKIAWAENPSLALQIAIRAQSPTIFKEVRWKLLNQASEAIDEPEALHVLFEDGLPKDVSFQLKYLLYWRPINPISAVTYFLPSFRHHPFILQYALRALESHSVDVTFFYVPQIVQTLRYDALGYVQRYIIETAKVSQLFAHQIIWNMKANAFKDEDSTVEDELKPTLDSVMQNMIESFSDSDKAFYEREFAFFNEVTGISGKLRPYIKREKSEKKQKIEEELRKIKVEVGVYLPSNPDGDVIGIDRKSGKPLQSHAKAPYMATFRIRKTRSEPAEVGQDLDDVDGSNQVGGHKRLEREATYDVWQSAIFKVGDDCRQDVLALQMIAAFRNIFNDVGLDVWVYPYRVTATAPGCGVIDVLPNSISRDMLGRETVNGLHDYFVSKYGGEDSIRFQEARNNFVKSMAAYSVISYLLQFKDRHNGNIMIDDGGHIIHIDFGFCFDIAPGGVKFERAPFKLTSEMVAVMGGNTNSQSYKWFEELCIKAFLASRPYTEKLGHLVVLMLDSGLPCFKPETITHFKDRFVLGKSEREAAEFMRDLIKKSHNSYSTKGYDQFQLLTNGIPY